MKRTRPVRFWKLWQKPPTDPADLLHWWYDRVLWERRPSLKRRLKLIWTTLAWPIDSAILIRKLVKEYGEPVHKGTGVSPTRQFFQAWWMAIRDFRVPIGYYKTRLYLPELQANAGRFLDTDEIRLLLTKINIGPETETLFEKRTFATACAQLRLPHISILAEYIGGKHVDPNPEPLPQRDLFVKVSNLASGLGAEAWFWRDGAYVDRHGTRLTREQLEARLTEKSVKNPAIVQVKLENHPDIQPFTNGALNTMRVVTGRLPGGEVEFVVAAFRMGVGKGVVDNFSDGGLACEFDFQTGELKAAIAKEPGRLPVTHHPDTNAPIKGTTLPMWKEAIELALRAHGHFPNVGLVGWDVAFGPDGPLFVEANPRWGCELPQIAMGKPITNAPRLTPIAVAWLEKNRFERGSDEIDAPTV